MAEAAAAGAAAETAAAAGCNNPALHWRWDPSLSGSLLFLSPPSLSNHCSNKLSCMLSPIIRRRFSQLGSQQTPLSSWKRLPVFSETPGPLSVAPSTFTLQINNALGAAGAQLQRRAASQWGPRIPSSHLPALKTKHSVPLTHHGVVKSHRIPYLKCGLFVLFFPLAFIV